MLQNCGIQEDFEIAYKQFGNGIRQCGNLMEVLLDGNMLKDNLHLLNPSFILQKQIQKVRLPMDCDP